MEPRSQTHHLRQYEYSLKWIWRQTISQNWPLPVLRVSYYCNLTTQFLEKINSNRFLCKKIFPILGLEGNGYLKALISAFPFWREGHMSSWVGPSLGFHTTKTTCPPASQPSLTICQSTLPHYALTTSRGTLKMAFWLISDSANNKSPINPVYWYYLTTTSANTFLITAPNSSSQTFSSGCLLSNSLRDPFSPGP